MELDADLDPHYIVCGSETLELLKKLDCWKGRMSDWLSFSMRVSFHNTYNLVNLGKLWCCCSWFFLTTFLWAGTTASRFTWTGTCTGRPGTAPWTVSLISINNVVLKSMLRTPPLGLLHHFAGSRFDFMFWECKRTIKNILTHLFVC